MGIGGSPPGGVRSPGDGANPDGPATQFHPEGVDVVVVLLPTQSNANTLRSVVIEHNGPAAPGSELVEFWFRQGCGMSLSPIPGYPLGLSVGRLLVEPSVRNVEQWE